MPRWLLPESISDVLPSQARRMEDLRRGLLDLYRSYGYELVMPPLVEYLDSLLTGTGGDLGLRTFKLVDQISGRTLGVRADMTPQVARIDAHLLSRQGLARLCYAGSVLHTRASGLFASREPIHVGAELYGHADHEADLEIIDLMVRSIRLAVPGPIRVDLCHMGIVPTLLEDAGGVDADEIYHLLQQKDAPRLAQALADAPDAARRSLLALTGLYGRADGAESVIERAREALPDLPPIRAALAQLARIAASTAWRRVPDVTLSIDFADLRGYRYHSGVSFAAYVDGLADAIARGGRYDNVGADFGRARPATGFSLELRELSTLQAAPPPLPAVRAPWSDDPALVRRIAELRHAGEVVIQSLPGHEPEHLEFAENRELVLEQGAWVVRDLLVAPAAASGQD